MSADLSNFLRMVTSGATTVTPEMWQHFDGDGMMAALKKLDPNAHVIEEDIGGGEGGAQGKGFRVDMDFTKLPKSKMGTAGYDLRPSNFGPLKNPNAVEHDDAYGDVTNSANVMKPKDPAWTKYAPMVVAAMASMGAALPAFAGASAATTAAATGSGLTGINAMNLPEWAIQMMSKAPQTADQLSHGNFNPLSLAPIAGGALGLDPNLTKGGVTLANLARSRP